MSDLFDLANDLESISENSVMPNGFDDAQQATTLGVVHSLRTMGHLLVDLRAVTDHYLPDPDVPDPGVIIRQGVEHCLADPDFEDRVLGSLGFHSGNDSIVVAALNEMVRTLTEGTS